MPKTKQQSKSEKIYLTTQHGSRLITAYKVVFPGFEKWDFYVHKTITPTSEIDGVYTVTEKKSGRSIPFENKYGPAFTKPEAIEQCNNYLNHHGIEVCDRVISEAIAKGVINE